MWSEEARGKKTMWKDVNRSEKEDKNTVNVPSYQVDNISSRFM